MAADRPGYGSNPRPAAGFAANARAVLDQLDARGIQRAMLAGHSYGGEEALAAASLAPHRVEAVVLLASVGPGSLASGSPGITRLRGRPPGPDEHVNWQVWADASRGCRGRGDNGVHDGVNRLSFRHGPAGN